MEIQARAEAAGRAQGSFLRGGGQPAPSAYSLVGLPATPPPTRPSLQLPTLQPPPCAEGGQGPRGAAPNPTAPGPAGLRPPGTNSLGLSRWGPVATPVTRTHQEDLAGPHPSPLAPPPALRKLLAVAPGTRSTAVTVPRSCPQPAPGPSAGVGAPQQHSARSRRVHGLLTHLLLDAFPPLAHVPLGTGFLGLRPKEMTSI